MSHIRTFTFASIAILTATAVAMATFPVAADHESDLTVSVTIDQTLPRVAGVVTVIDADGSAVSSARVQVTSTLDLAPSVPAASSSGATGPSGVFEFAFGYASTGSVPGDHTLTVTVSHGGQNETVQVSYFVPEL